MDEEQVCTCGACSNRMIDQSCARYNDQSSFNLLQSQQNFLMQQQANWNQLLLQTQQHQATSNAAMLKNIDRFMKSS